MKLYNTMSRQKEALVPLRPGKASLYTCGPTVYDEPHIGNWRTFVFYDTLSRALKLDGLDVEHVLNITDVGHLTSDQDEGEDKLAKAARRQRKTAWEIADHYSRLFTRDMRRLNLLAPTHLPRATDYIDQQIAFVRTLESKGYTYTIDDGVYFDTGLLDDYGKLARLDTANLKAGARVEFNPKKRQPTDFALWKFSPPDEKRDMEWDSPWGKGFPGWHLECSVMAKELLGVTIDIHGGGVDHIPLHHTNEIAQSESANGRPLANLWVHGEFIKINDAKIAKSAGNSITVGDVVANGFDPLALRLLYLQAHYKTESNFSWENLAAAQNRLKGLRNLAELRFQPFDYDSEDEAELIVRTRREIEDAIKDDLNTPLALRAISALEEGLEDTLSSSSAEPFSKLLRVIDDALGLDLLGTTSELKDELKNLLAERETARQNEDWDKADGLRDKLEAEGIELKDTPHGVIWQSA